MKKIIIVCLLTVAVLVSGFAQEEQSASEGQDLSTIDAADPSKIGNFSAEQRLKEVSVDKFETEGTWNVSMSSDEGVIQGRLFDGNPMNKKPIPEEEGLELADEKVFGAKISFYRRGYNSFEITAAKALPVEGITKTVSVWVVGRSYAHNLNLIVEDYWGQRFELYVGKLNFSGWKLMTVAVPPQHADGRSGIVQKDYHYGNHLGLKIVGFRVDCDPWDAYGKYYIYFDDLRAVTDLYEIDARDPDDMADNW
ncbi:flagellar filament protein FlaA [Treponema phagedenis]|uniref:Flagellar filament outer layer protein FlaA n=1 Tax=Treponema phagedenis TaxID=162 RepID=A0A0B7GZY4_TREPH|nr:flagellar filament outer layer protein FlaA [Treponema phagedenis]EFW38331.1 flagellar filament outer layer protein FlaA [Treponema phagedenis F0421]NVP25035.1 flagellar filament protein FlaA [Treponema phagedenis]QEJ94051.1 flagellar filament protein FlaA [Treponema phagedenis]QEJ97150.1 flagellar filament protein FlaA [Treponema phagedenis]QEK01939.1 flagellar filament protein FlaA [Treponema phagedenis]